MCKLQDIHIVNGRVQGDENGEFTCVTPRGCSTVDYFIASTREQEETKTGTGVMPPRSRWDSEKTSEIKEKWDQHDINVQLQHFAHIYRCNRCK